MRIDPNQGLSGAEGTASDRVASPAPGAASRTAQQSSALQSDQANLSPDAIEYSKLRSAIVNVPEIRTDRVSSLRQTIQAGTYSVSNQQIASALRRDPGSIGAAGK